MFIRAATLADAPGITALVQRYWAFEALDGFDAARIERLIENLLSRPQLGAVWLAETDGSLCGYLTAVFLFSLEHGGLMAEIDEIFVLPEKRCAGVGSLLVAGAERDMAVHGIARLQLQLGIGNHRGRGFYERHGFRRRAGYELFEKAL